MPVAEQCPQCGKSLGKIAFLSEVPECESCGSVFKDVGGTLSLVGDFGVDDSTISRQRVEADLAVFDSHLQKYRGMLESHKEQLTWGVERYAKLPPEPEMLQLKEAPSVDQTLTAMLKAAGYFVTFAGILVVPLMMDEKSANLVRGTNLRPIIFLGALMIAIPLVQSLIANLANGRRPYENARRKQSHEQAVAAALKAAEPIKAAEDHRLRVRIQKLNRSIKTLEEKQENVRRILTTL